MIKTVLTIPVLILLLALTLPVQVRATNLTCSVTGANPYCAGSTSTVNFSGTFFIFQADNTFTVQLSDATGNFSSPMVIGTLASTSQTGSISVTFPADASGAAYRVRVVASDPATVGDDNGSDIVINASTNTSVSITVDHPGGILCDTQTATFAAVPNPNVVSDYAWTRNGSPVGTNSASYMATDFQDGDAVKVTMTSSATCPLPAAAQSNTIVITQKATVTPTITISGPAFICANTNTTFTATISNGGTSPSYQWKRNGNPVGTNSATFITNALITGDVLIAELTSSRACVTQQTVSSNNINVSLTSVANPTISITADPSTTVGAGSVVYVTSAIAGGGTSPAYQWTRNGVATGNANTLLITDPVDGEQIAATLTSSANCAQPPAANSNIVTLSVNNNLTQTNHAWTPRAGQTDINGVIARVNGSGFSIGTKGYIGVGYVGSTSNLRKDFWEYDPLTDTWTQKANFAGAARYNAVGFSVAGKGYIGTGVTASGAVKDLYQYDPITNQWKVRASLPSAAAVREQAFGFGAGIKGYIGGGYNTSVGDLNDFYEYDPSGNSWIAKSPFGGGKRLGAATFTIDPKAYVAGGYSTTTSTWFKDLWEFDPSSNTWIQHADMPGNGRSRATGFTLAGNGYVGLGNTAGGYAAQLYQYTVSTDSWVLRQYYPGPQTTNAAVGMTIGNRSYVYKDGTWTEFNFFTMGSFSSKVCTGETIPISFDASGYSFAPNTTFTAQISTQPNFAVGTNLGTLTAGASNGTVNANFLPTIGSGTYYIRVVTNNAPPLSTMLESVTVTNIPGSQTITAAGGTTICKDTPVTFTTNLTGTGFQWLKNNAAVGTDSPSYTDAALANSDVIKVIKSYTAGCSQPTAVSSNLITMKVHTPAKPVVTVKQPNILFASAATAYQWYEGGSAISNAINQSYVMTESGVYKVKATDNNGCEIFSDDIINAFTGIDDEFAGQINTYPNPVSGEMIVEIADDLLSKGVDYSVLNQLGQPVISTQKASGSNKINFSGKASGLYLLRLTINGSTLIRRVVKVD